MFSKHMQDVYGNTALVEARYGGHVKTAMVLLDHGAGANMDDQNMVIQV